MVRYNTFQSSALASTAPPQRRSEPAFSRTITTERQKREGAWLAKRFTRTSLWDEIEPESPIQF